MSQGSFWIENRKLENHNLKKKYLMIFGFQKKLDKGVGGLGELYSNVIWMFGNFITLQ